VRNLTLEYRTDGNRRGGNIRFCFAIGCDETPAASGISPHSSSRSCCDMLPEALRARGEMGRLGRWLWVARRDWEDHAVLKPERDAVIDLGGDVCSNGISKLVFTILSAVAENERERVRDAKRHRGSQLLFNGGKRPFGFDVDGEGKQDLVPNATEQAALARGKALQSEAQRSA
jgi:hypothetical protein